MSRNERRKTGTQMNADEQDFCLKFIRVLTSLFNNVAY